MDEKVSPSRYFSPLMDFGNIEYLFLNFYQSGLFENEILYVLKNLLEALIYVHKKKVIHR